MAEKHLLISRIMVYNKRAKQTLTQGEEMKRRVGLLSKVAMFMLLPALIGGGGIFFTSFKQQRAKPWQ